MTKTALIHPLKYTDGHIFSKGNLPKGMFIPYQVTGLSVTEGPDQLFVIHVEGGNDFVFCLQDRKSAGKEERVGELVGIICRQFKKYDWLSSV